MSDSPLAELRGERRITVPIDPDLDPNLGQDAAVVLGGDPFGIGLEVLIAEWTGAGEPPVTLQRRLHERRLGKRTSPLVTVIRRRTPRGEVSQRRRRAESSSLHEPGASGSPSDPQAIQPNLLVDGSLDSHAARGWLVAGDGPEQSTADVWVLGPESGAPRLRLSESQAASMLGAALEEREGAAARRRIVSLLSTAEEQGDHAGLTNSGLFSSYYLLERLPEEERWREAQKRARPMLSTRGYDLIRALGFRILEPIGHARVLASAQDEQRAVALLVNRDETFEAESERFGQSPAAYGLAKARQRNADWLILMRGAQLRLYSAEAGVGVGSRSRAETWLELDLDVLSEQQAAYLDLVFSATALAREGTVVDLLSKSTQFTTDLGSRLRQRIYERVVPDLAVGVAEALDRRSHQSPGGDLQYSYRLSLRILFRLLFQAYAEDRGLLPYGRNNHFDRHSLKKLAIDLATEAERSFDAGATTLWSDLQTIWKAIDRGDSGMNVPAYNGGLFDADPEYRPEGADLASIELANDVMGPVLRDLLVDETPGGVMGPVDFRSLSVREFGTIYEGLLESELSRAEVDLTVDKRDAYRPAKGHDEVVVRAGEVYFHNRSGERKATGSYFTPEFAVEHLLNQALEPALKEHLTRVADLYDRGDKDTAAEVFWDFRVADIAMGSGHFLIAAIDHIDLRMQEFLGQLPLPEVHAELVRLEQKAHQNLGSRDTEIERSTLLRRQIARRCIYGVDLNQTAVELARVAVWIHTFVPGLPISTLDHNLVCGDSLTGVGTVKEALDVLDPDQGAQQMSLYSQPILDAMQNAALALADMSAALEADTAEVARSREELAAAKRKAEPARRLFDAAVALRLELADLPAGRNLEEIAAIALRPEVAAEIERIRPAHMPSLFPEVFTRERPGFDVLIGNPPWEEATVEELGFWAARFPGLKSLRQKEQQPEIERIRTERPDLVVLLADELARSESQRRALLTGPYPGMGTGDPDLYKAFCWRYWHLAREDGAAGVVLPRSALSVKGSGEWRKAVLGGGAFSDVTLLLNKGRWVFDMEPRYTIGLVSLRRGPDHKGTLRLRGPYDSQPQYEAGTAAGSAAIPVDEFLTWSDSAALPSIPSDAALQVFRKMRTHPRLDLSVEPVSASRRKDQGSRIKDQGSRIKDQGSRIKDQGSRIKDQGSRIKDQGSRIKDQGSRIKDQGSRIKDQGSRIKDQGSRIKDRTTESRERRAAWKSLGDPDRPPICTRRTTSTCSVSTSRRVALPAAAGTRRNERQEAVHDHDRRGSLAGLRRPFIQPLATGHRRLLRLG